MARKTALYVRSSKDRHDVSVDSQIRELTKHAATNGDVVVTEFVDKVESAKTDDRPGFQAMIDEAKKKTCRFQVLYCYDTSRFSRRQYHAQMYKHLLKKHRIDLVFLKLPKTDTILDPIIESLMEAFDEFHSQKSKMDGLRGMRENIEQGWRAGGRAILGYRLDKHILGSREGKPLTKSKLVPDPKTFFEIQKYMKGRARAESRRGLLEQIRLDVPYSTLVYLEDSALTYAGHTVWNKHREFVDGAYVGGGTGRYRDQADWVINRNTHDAMITDEEAEAIFRHRDKQKRKHSRFRRNHYLMSCLMKCQCGASMDGDSGYYRCHKRCGTKSIKKESLERAIVAALFDGMFTDEMLMKLQDESRQLFNETQPRQTYLNDQIRSEIKDSERQINELAAMLTEVKHRRPLLQRMDLLEGERQDMELRLQDLKELDKPKILQMSKSDLAAFANQWKTDLSSGTMEKRKAIFRQLVAGATYDGETVEINPSYEAVTGVKMASPRGFEPLLPP